MARDESSLERRADAVLFLLALLLYLATTTRFAVPGESAWLLAGHTGLSGLPPVTHSLWGNLVWLLKCLPVGPLAAKANLLSAVCAAGAVWLFVRCVRDLPVRREYLQTFPGLRTLAAVAGGLYLALSLPVWKAATRAHYDAFDLFLFLLCLRLLQQYAAQPGRLRSGCLFILLFGVGFVESPLFAPWAPFLAVLFLLITWLHGPLRLRALCWFGLSVLGAVAWGLLVGWWFTRRPDFVWGDEFRRPLDVMIYLWREKAAFLTGDVSRKGWLFVGLLSVLPVAVAVGNTRLSPTGIGRLWCVVSSLLVFLGSALLLLNLPWSPWLFTRTRDVHMVPAALLAAAFGLALATLVFWLRRREWFSNMSWPRGPEWVAALLLALALLPAGALTYYRVHTRLARLLHYVTHGMLHALGERQWLVTEGVLDTLLQVGACERGQTLYLLNGPQSAYRPYRRMLQKRFPHEPRQRGLALYSPRGLLREWLQEDPEVTGKLAVEQSHSLWRDNGFAAVPVCGLYLGFRPDPGEVDAVGLFEQQKVFWSGLVELLEHAPAAYHPEEKELRRRVLAHVSKLANEFGLVLEAEKQPVLAAECYGLARRIDPDNLMAFLNQYQLRVDAGDPDVDEIWRQVRRETFKAGAAVPVQMLLLRYGPVRNTELAIRYRRLYEPQEPPAPPAAAEAGMAQVRAARREGRSADAMRLAQEVIKSYDMPEAWVVLGLLAYDAGDLPLFERCFQHMQSLNQFWPDLLVVAGREAFRKKDWRLARRHFDAACNVQPTNHVALEYLIRIALITQDTRRVVPPLDQLLAIDPGNATANYAMAYLHFVQGEYGLAEMTLDKSLEYRADATAIANLAWLLQVQGKEDVALKYARQAVKLDAGLAPAWDILASVLLAQGDLTGAEEAINEALRIEPNIIEIQFNQMRILARSGRGAQVREMAERLDKSGIPFTPEQRRELERHLAPAPP